MRRIRGIPSDNIKIIQPFKPLDWQVKAWRDTSPILLLTGSAGGGKSRLAGEKIHAFCKRYPGSMALMLRKTRESMTNSTVLFMERAVIGEDPGVRHCMTRHRFEYANGSILAYGGMKDEDQREQIRSMGQEGGIDIVWMEEANKFTEDDFNEVLARMRGHRAPWTQIILTTNPDAPSHWIYKRLIQGGEATVIRSGAPDNPYNPPSYLKRLQELTGILGKRLRDGLWVQAEGIVYEEFDVDLHVIDEVDAGQMRRMIVSVDWGFTNPGVMQVWGADGDGRMYLIHEVCQMQRDIDWWTDKARQLKARYPKIESFVCDPSEPGYIQKFRNAGLRAEKANNDVTLGIQMVKGRLKVAGDGRPRLFVYRQALESVDPKMEEAKRPVGLLEEISLYVFQSPKPGHPAKEEPVKENDHSMDAMRYAVMHFDRPHGAKFGKMRYL